MSAESPQTVRLGTRGSLLARTQTQWVGDRIGKSTPGLEPELTIVTTPGDLSQAPVERIGVGVFTQALREALDGGECDVAVHSYKDLPTAPDPRFHLIVPERAVASDVLVARDGFSLDTLPEGAVVGTSAPRRIAQVKAKRPDLAVVFLRGNIDTRIKAVTTGRCDAVILAAAGLARIGRLDEATEIFNPDEFLPAPAQGALAVECRTNDRELVAALSRIADPSATVAAAAERQLLATLEAGCTAPVGAHARIDEAGVVHLSAGVFALDGSTRLVVEQSAPAEEAGTLGCRVAEELLAQGAAAVMDRKQ